jgi:hypothetical protein
LLGVLVALPAALIRFGAPAADGPGAEPIALHPIPGEPVVHESV